jgi:MinD superfamily P-loop ATPase
MIISVASGKGGTGKTFVATNLALSIEREVYPVPINRDGVQFLDCDVEEPDGHIFLKPTLTESQPVNIPIPRVDQEKCNACGICVKVCQFNALALVKEKVLVFPELCKGCGGCSLLCPQKAISEVERPIGVMEKGKAGEIDFIRGRLNISEIQAVPIIRKLKREIKKNKIVIIDVSPGTSCPMVESIRGSDFCTLVTEPTPFGLHDLKMAVEVVKKLKIPFGVIINRDGIGDEKVEEFCRENKIPILLKIPYSKDIAFAYSKGAPIIEEKSEYKAKFKELFNSIRTLIITRMSTD